MIQLNTVKYKDSLLIIIRLYHIDRQILLLILTQCDLPKNPSLAVLMRNLNEITVHLIFFFFFNLSSLIALFQTLWFEFIDFQDAHTGKMHVCGMYLLSHSSSLFSTFTPCMYTHCVATFPGGSCTKALIQRYILNKLSYQSVTSQKKSLCNSG